jgi:DNA-directed RNA polymerase specialized sigma24 family protein
VPRIVRLLIAELDPQQARVVELRYFAGLSVEETAEVIRLPRRSASRAAGCPPHHGTHDGKDPG